MIYAEYKAVEGDIVPACPNIGKRSRGPDLPADYSYRTVEIKDGVYRIAISKESPDTKNATVVLSKDDAAAKWGVIL